jgi:hypothetical protein
VSNYVMPHIHQFCQSKFIAPKSGIINSFNAETSALFLLMSIPRAYYLSLNFSFLPPLDLNGISCWLCSSQLYVCKTQLEKPPRDSTSPFIRPAVFVDITKTMDNPGIVNTI